MMDARNRFYLALSMATEAHEGQKDKAGLPYILHPIGVAHLVQTVAGHQPSLAMDELHQAALLHDVLEDTELTMVDLLDAGFSAQVIRGVRTVSRREGEAYTVFIDRIAKGERFGMVLKLADLEHNLHHRQLFEGATRQQQRKYERAQIELTRALREDERRKQ
ncbi:MAG: HD domain-containing protein [Dehalococcoidia bacterium]